MAGFGIWLKELRAEFLTASIVPVLLGGALARYDTGSLDQLTFALTLAGAAFLHIGANVANDYFDHVSGNDPLNTRFVRPFTGGSRLIQEGLITPGAVLVTSIIFIIAAVIVGIVLTLMKGPVIIVLGLAGIISGFFYTAPPIRFAYRGIGELIVGINFGLLIVIGTYFVQTGTVTAAAVVASLPLTLLVAAIIIINEFQDSNADARVGKRTLVVRLGTRKSSVLFAAVVLGAFACLIAGVFVRLLPPHTLIALVSILFAFKAITTARRHHNATTALIPANAMTIITHLLTGLLMTAGYMWAG